MWRRGRLGRNLSLKYITFVLNTAELTSRGQKRASYLYLINYECIRSLIDLKSKSGTFKADQQVTDLTKYAKSALQSKWLDRETSLAGLPPLETSATAVTTELRSLYCAVRRRAPSLPTPLTKAEKQLRYTGSCLSTCIYSGPCCWSYIRAMEKMRRLSQPVFTPVIYCSIKYLLARSRHYTTCQNS